MDAPTVKIEKGYILVEFPPGYVATDQIPHELYKEIGAACSQAQTSKVLMVAEEVQVELSTGDMFQRGKALEDINASIAVVNKHGLSTDDAKFMESTTALRTSKMKIFETLELAKEWLGVE